MNRGESEIKMKHYYGKDENQFGELRIPNGDGPFPVIIIVHGGGWSKHVGLHVLDPVAEILTDNGYATWNIEYRRIGQEGGGWPGTFHDVSNAADYVKTLANTYPIDVDRVFTLGHSAGGHLALWIAGRHRLPLDSELATTKNPVQIKGVINLAGISDLRTMYTISSIASRRIKTGNSVFDFMQGSPSDIEDRYNEASPIALLPIGVKQLIIHGSLDTVVPIGLNVKYKETAEKLGDTVKFAQLPEAEHFLLTDTTSEVWQDVLKETLHFIEAVNKTI